MNHRARRPLIDPHLRAFIAFAFGVWIAIGILIAALITTSH